MFTKAQPYLPFFRRLLASRVIERCIIQILYTSSPIMYNKHDNKLDVQRLRSEFRVRKVRISKERSGNTRRIFEPRDGRIARPRTHE